ncbi:MAG: nucleotidyltransferase domain-containing protein [Bacteroidetes bacterium]|nr:nucleotidyltransferase domain-containing protein [Bacteroidia bacterium]MCO5288533.1 nucleotidyltransferase domain-containing protein [Bacteroidota bacterium]
MASISINNKLITFAQQQLVLGYTTNERERITGSLTQLQKVLNDKLYNETKEVKIFGSYTRNTILPRNYDSNSDVDVLVIFNTANGKKTPDTYRKNIVDALAKSYPLSVVKKDFPTVKLELNHIMFDVVPCYTEEFWSSKTFYIPNANDSWRTTVPNDINNELSQKNQSYGNNIVRNVIRLCKHWNASQGRYFDSYEMEKWIIQRHFYSGDNLYDKFLSVMNDLAGSHSGVRQALDYIQKYKGDYWNQPNELKQLEWLQKLLPGLK